MTNANDVRRAHRLVIALKGGSILSSHDVDFLRSFLPDLPKQKTLEEIAELVNEAWNDIHGHLESWLSDLEMQLRGLADAKPAHPEFLETEADYSAAPEGTIVACEDSLPWHKFDSALLSTAVYEGNSAKNMTGIIRRVLRWGNE